MRFEQFLLFLLIGIFSCTVVAQGHVQDSDSYSESTLGLASYQLHNQQYKNAIKTLDEFLIVTQDREDTVLQYRGYSLLGNVYLSLKDTLRSREVFEKALLIAQSLSNDTLLASSYNNLGKVYAASSGSQDKGILYLRKSIDINEKLSQADASLESYIYSSRILLKQENFKEAYPMLMKAKFASLRDTLDYKSRTQVLTLLGIYYTDTDKKNLAETSFLDAIDIAFAEGLVVEEEEAQNRIVAFYQKDGDLEAAFYHVQRQLQLSKELYKNESQRELQLASAQFDFRESERDLEITKKKKKLTDIVAASSLRNNTALIITSFILLIACFIIYVMYRARRDYSLRLRQKNRQLIRAKNEAEELSKLKTQFFSTISHELRTPLYGVIGIASILLEDKKIKTHRDDLKSLKFSADYLLALINDVLLMSKMEAKDITLEHTPFKLTTLLRSITRSFEFSLEQNNNKLHLYIDPEVPKKLVGDSVRLSQILMNLIGNAIKFNENGNIWIKIHKRSMTTDGLYRTEFIVKDDGIGIPKSSHTSIFEEFSQVENNSYNYQGTGLGLPIVKKLLALYGSDIHLESDEGQGAVFSFVINLEKAAGAEAISQLEIDHLEIESVHTLQEVHILVVDDNRINQKVTQKLLENKGFSCSLASDGVEAVEMAKTSLYDLILMDIHMPKKDGIEATEDIRKFDNATPIIALTAVEIDEIRHKIHQAGMDDILVKPYDVSQFLSVILRNIKKKRIQTVIATGD